MAVELHVNIRNARLDAIESTIGTTPILEVFTGSPPADLATGDSGTKLCSITLPSDWMGAASSGSKSKSGTWQDTSADAGGTPGYWRLKNSAGTTAYMQGTAGVGSGDLSFDAAISLGGTVTVNSFTLTDGNSDT